jgi:Protein of unknown function (DUF3352)
MHRLVIALTTLVVLAGATFLGVYLLLLAGATDRAASLVPADAIAYANIYLQPSTSQQMRLGALIGRLPGFDDSATIDEKIDQIAQNLLSSTGVDYRADVRPWLGNQVSLAVIPAGEEAAAPQTIAFLAVTDEAEARAALGRTADEQGIEPETTDHAGTEVTVAGEAAWAFVDELLVVSQTPSGVETAIDVDGGEPALASSTTFRDAMADLPPDHLASVFLDLSRAAQLTGSSTEIAGWSVAGAALIAEEGGLRLAGTAPFDAGGASASANPAALGANEPSTLVDWMPADTRAEAVLFGARQLIEDAEAAAAGSDEGPALTDALATARAVASFAFGLDFDAEVLPLFDREIGIAISGLRDGLPAGQLLLHPTDGDAAADVLERLTTGLEGLGATVTTTPAGNGAEITNVEVPDTGSAAYAIHDGVVILGLAVEDVAAAIEAKESGDSLASSDAYAATFELAGEHAGNELYLDVGAILDATQLAAGLPSDARDILNQLGAIGFTAPPRDDRIDFRAVLTVE